MNNIENISKDQITINLWKEVTAMHIWRSLKRKIWKCVLIM